MKTRAGAVVATAAFAIALAGCASGSPTSGGASPPEKTIGGQDGVPASCGGAAPTVRPTPAAAGDAVHVTGKWFAADCYDTGQPGTPPPLTGLTLEVSQSGTSWPVAHDVDASG